MPPYVSNATLAQAADRILRSGSTVVTTHAKPDGDAFGAVVALTAALRGMGREARGVLMPPVPANFRTLRGNEHTRVLEGGALPEAELCVVLDTGASAQLAPIRESLGKLLDRTLILDHHLTGDVEAAHRYIDGGAAATCEIVGTLLEHVAAAQGLEGERHPFANPAVRDALFVGIASDTGWFRYSNTRPETLELAARLLRRGVDHADLFRKLEQTERPEKLKLLGCALASLRFVAAGRAAIMVLRAEEFSETGALIEETERFVDVPQMVESVEVVVLITEPPERAAGPSARHPVRMSFRSKPGPEAVDVTRLAATFGGGGHARAAGAKADAPLAEVTAKVVELLEQRLSPTQVQ